MEPGASVIPVPVSSGGGDAEGLAGLVHVQAREVTQLDDLAADGSSRASLARASSMARSWSGVALAARSTASMSSLLSVPPRFALLFSARGQPECAASLRPRRRRSAPGCPIAGLCPHPQAGRRPHEPGPWPGVSGPAFPGPAWPPPASAARRRPGARAVRRRAGRLARWRTGCV